MLYHFVIGSLPLCHGYWCWLLDEVNEGYVFLFAVLETSLSLHYFSEARVCGDDCSLSRLDCVPYFCHQTQRTRLFLLILNITSPLLNSYNK